MKLRIVESAELSPSSTLEFASPTAAVLCLDGVETAAFDQAESACLYELLSKRGLLLGWETLYNSCLPERGAKNPKKSVQDVMSRVRRKLAAVLALPPDDPERGICGRYFELPPAERGSCAYVIRIGEEHLIYADDSYYELGEVEYRLAANQQVAPYAGENYISRPDIEQALAAAAAQKRIVFLSGMGGIGKSEVARSYARMQQEQGRAATVIQLEYTPGPQAFARAVQSCDAGDAGTRIYETPRVTAGKKPDKEEQLQIKLDLLARAAKNVLLLVHNYDQPDIAFLQELRDKTAAARIIVTTRLSADPELAGYGPVISFDNYRDSQEDFACRLFCLHANLSPQLYRDDVAPLIGKIGGHTLMAELLGKYICDIADGTGSHADIRAILADLNASVKLGLQNVDGLSYQKDGRAVLQGASTYRILKELFKSVWNTAFAPLERQIFGALLLLPKELCRKGQLAALLGDLADHRCRRAVRALNGLIRRGFVQERGERVLLHPLIAELVADPMLGGVYNDAIAEQSADFMLHLLNNAFVADDAELTEWVMSCGDAYAARYGADLRDLPDAALGWALLWWHDAEWRGDAPVRLQQQIAANHAALDMEMEPDRIARLLWCCEGLLFVMEHQQGRSLWLLHAATKQLWCVLNCSAARLPQYRYYGEGERGVQSSPPQYCTLFGTTYYYEPQALYVPGQLFGVPVTGVDICVDATALRVLCLPPQLQEVLPVAFWQAEKLERLLFCGEQLHSIGRAAFGMCGRLQEVLLPSHPFRIGATAFVGCSQLQRVVLPRDTQLEVEMLGADMRETAGWPELMQGFGRLFEKEGIDDPEERLMLTQALAAYMLDRDADVEETDDLAQLGQELLQHFDAEKIAPFFRRMQQTELRSVGIDSSRFISSPVFTAGRTEVYPFGDMQQVLLHLYDTSLTLHKASGDEKLPSGRVVQRQLLLGFIRDVFRSCAAQLVPHKPGLSLLLGDLLFSVQALLQHRRDLIGDAERQLLEAELQQHLHNHLIQVKE